MVGRSLGLLEVTQSGLEKKKKKIGLQQALNNGIKCLIKFWFLIELLWINLIDVWIKNKKHFGDSDIFMCLYVDDMLFWELIWIIKDLLFFDIKKPCIDKCNFE